MIAGALPRGWIATQFWPGMTAMNEAGGLVYSESQLINSDGERYADAHFGSVAVLRAFSAASRGVAPIAVTTMGTKLFAPRLCV
jgi:hypothetical protein